jgi:hypothetical protein
MSMNCVAVIIVPISLAKHRHAVSLFCNDVEMI